MAEDYLIMTHNGVTAVNLTDDPRDVAYIQKILRKLRKKTNVLKLNCIRAKDFLVDLRSMKNVEQLVIVNHKNLDLGSKYLLKSAKEVVIGFSVVTDARKPWTETKSLILWDTIIMTPLSSVFPNLVSYRGPYAFALLISCFPFLEVCLCSDGILADAAGRDFIARHPLLKRCIIGVSFAQEGEYPGDDFLDFELNDPVRNQIRTLIEGHPMLEKAHLRDYNGPIVDVINEIMPSVPVYDAYVEEILRINKTPMGNNIEELGITEGELNAVMACDILAHFQMLDDGTEEDS